MSRGVFGCLVVAALAIALAFRLAAPHLRPMHHDEANQAVKFGALLETGEYRYDRNDHHGPTLYYLTLPSVWLRGQATLASLDERTLRVVPALFGAGLILLLLPLAGGLGRTAVAAAALLVALSPALTYYSRFYIQESLFVFFALGFLVALGRCSEDRRAVWAVCAGLFAGLAYATKETSLIVLLAGVVAAGAARVWTRAIERATRRATDTASGTAATMRTGSPDTRDAGSSAETGPSAQAAAGARARTRLANLALGLAVALLVAFLFYSSFFRYPLGLLESFRAFATYIERGVAPGSHAHPWHYYLGLLAYSSSGGLVWTEGLVLLLALVGLVAAAMPGRARAVPAPGLPAQAGRGFSPAKAGLKPRPTRSECANPDFWPRYVALYSVITALAFSAVRYKTPWNLLPFYAGVVMLAGYGAAALIGMARPRAVRTLLVIALLAAAAQLSAQNWRANFPYPADPRNPYVYAQTTPDFLRLVQRVTDLAALHPDHANMLVKVIAGPHEQWPLPWYLRRMTRVGYWARASEAVTPEEAPVIVASQENAAAVDATLGDRYVSEFYGLRPEVVLTVFIERGLWDRLLASRLGSR